ncbi:hypothetical protein K7432_009596 [Basidiobolus ranarum]|uniref:Cyclin n=1 Tax=Basidiobolus ranarum TaxID=34480 RepID=A0ABR2WPY8_9FUNG
MASHTMEKQTKRASPYAIARRKRASKNTRVSNRETTKRTSPKNSLPTDNSASAGPRILTPREQVLVAYAGVYVPESNHVQAPVLKRLFAFKNILSLSPQLISVAGKLIQAHWESTAISDELTPGDRNQTARSMHLTGYISAILARSLMLQSNSVASKFPPFPTVALVFALIYVERLKKLHPNARGEAGCGHRLFLVSYMVACKYLQGHILAWGNHTPTKSGRAASVPVTREPHRVSSSPQHSTPLEHSSVLPSIILPNEQWARLSGVFSTPELTRMELELLAFLQFDLNVSYEDFNYHWSKYMDINQLVPNEQPSIVSTHTVFEETDDEGVVPDF